MSEPSTKLGKRLCALMSYDVKLTDWDRAAADFANEIRGEAIPWAHKALDEVGAPKGPDIAGRIRMLHDRSIDVIAPAHKALDDAGVPPSLDMARRIRALDSMKGRERTGHSQRAADLAEKLRAMTAARDELRAIIVEAIKGGA